MWYTASTTYTRSTPMQVCPAFDTAPQAAASAEQPTYETTLLPIDLAWARVAEAYGKGAFMGQVSTDEAVRNAGTAISLTTPRNAGEKA